MEMVNDLNALLMFAGAIASAVMVIIKYVIIVPLKASIDRLSDTVDTLKETVVGMDARQREFAERLAKVEQCVNDHHSNGGGE